MSRIWDSSTWKTSALQISSLLAAANVWMPRRLAHRSSRIVKVERDRPAVSGTRKRGMAVTVAEGCAHARWRHPRVPERAKRSSCRSADFEDLLHADSRVYRNRQGRVVLSRSSL